MDKLETFTGKALIGTKVINRKDIPKTANYVDEDIIMIKGVWFDVTRYRAFYKKGIKHYYWLRKSYLQ
jgi:hypothetical protein